MSDVTQEVLAALRDVVLPLVIIHDRFECVPIGTAFVIVVANPKTALLLTAAHNVKCALQLERRGQRHHPTTPTEFLPAESNWINLQRTKLGVVRREAVGAELLDVTRIWYVSSTDIAVLFVQIPEASPSRFGENLGLDTTPIAAGTRVVAVGYHSMRASHLGEPNYELGRASVMMEHAMEYRGGRVAAYHPVGAPLYPWPGFTVDFPFDSGMSGGPVIDLNTDMNVPRARGLVCGDMSQTEAAFRGSGVRPFASCLWPAMVTSTQIAIEAPNGSILVSGNATLLDLVKYRVIDDLGQAHEHVKFEDETRRAIRWVA
jgi:hypothetical protein